MLQFNFKTISDEVLDSGFLDMVGGGGFAFLMWFSDKYVSNSSLYYSQVYFLFERF